MAYKWYFSLIKNIVNATGIDLNFIDCHIEMSCLFSSKYCSMISMLSNKKQKDEMIFSEKNIGGAFYYTFFETQKWGHWWCPVCDESMKQTVQDPD